MMIAMYYKQADTNDERAAHWYDRYIEIKNDREAKYPVFKLINQKIQQHSQGRDSDDSDDTNGEPRSNN